MKVKISSTRIIGYLVIILGILLVVALLGTIKFSWQQSFRVVFGGAYVLFLPGFVWSYVFFNHKHDESVEHSPTLHQADKDKETDETSLDVVERILLSFALSIASTPLILFFLNKIGVKINLWNSFFIILGLIVIGLGVIIYKRNSFKKVI